MTVGAPWQQLCYAWTGAIHGVQTAVYFSAVTYTTTGYGDLTLPAARTPRVS
jgi:hypothetical protein